MKISKVQLTEIYHRESLAEAQTGLHRELNQCTFRLKDNRHTVVYAGVNRVSLEQYARSPDLKSHSHQRPE